MNSGRSPISYRDPHGYVLEYNGVHYRIVDETYKEQYSHLIQSGLYDVLVKQKLLTPFKEIDKPFELGATAFKILLPEQLEFMSYPYEWCFRQWQNCLLAFLTINRLALQYGMILKDATPFNFTMQRGRFVLFDILSFEFYSEGAPWVAYRQFCENFLSPISLIKYKGSFWPKLYSSSINGFDLQFVSGVLPVASYFNINCLLHVHLHIFLGSKFSNNQTTKTSFLQKEQLLQLMDSLSQLTRWKLGSKKKSGWNSYYQEAIQSQVYLSHKEKVLEEWLKRLQPEMLCDIGANTGKFSLIAAKYSKKVIAIESDFDSIESLYDLANKYENIYPICANLADPSPALGWANAEKKSLLARLQTGTVMALALIHHLRITYNIPIALIANLFHSITQSFLILEFVPKSDEKIKAMLRNKNDIYLDYTLENVIAEFSMLFEINETIHVNDSQRVLLLCSKK
jgi:hypothetical protein